MKYLHASLIRGLKLSLKKSLAFVCKDFICDSSYQFAFVAQFIGILLSVMTFFFLSKLFGSAISPYLKLYGGDYFSFVLIGLAFGNYLRVSLSSFSNCIREAQILGTLEAILLTQTEIPTIIVCSALYSFVITSMRVIVFLLLGVFAFGLEMGKANFGGAFLILSITIVAFSSLGIISASFIMVLKRGDPFELDLHQFVLGFGRGVLPRGSSARLGPEDLLSLAHYLFFGGDEAGFA